MITTPLGFKIVARFARKPIWMPTAPSKLFRIAEHTFYDKEEVLQISKLHYAYRAQMESIGKYMEQEFYIPATRAGGIPPEFIKSEQEEEKEIIAENDRINAEIARQKDEYFSQKLKETEDKVMQRKLDKEEQLIEAAQQIDEYIRAQKTNPDSCVTAENIDSQIDRSLENPVSFEFCIDKTGRRLGLQNLPPRPPQSQRADEARKNVT